MNIEEAEQVQQETLSFGGAASKNSSDSEEFIDDENHLSGDDEGELSAQENSWIHPPAPLKNQDTADRKLKIPRSYFARQISKHRSRHEHKLQDKNLIYLTGLPVDFEPPKSSHLPYPVPSRRCGSALGPIWLEKRIDFSPLAAVECGDSWRFINQLNDVQGENAANPDIVRESLQMLLGKLNNTNLLKRHAIIVGGANNCLNKLDELQAELSFSHVIKISPLLSTKPKSMTEPLNHYNYAGQLSPQFSEKLYHVGVVPELLTRVDERRFAETCALFAGGKGVDPATRLFQVRNGVSVAQDTQAILQNATGSEPVLFVLDTEAITGSVFPGSSLASSGGLSGESVLEFAQVVGKTFATRNQCVLLVTNYTPGVESRKSGDFLLALIRTVCQHATTAQN